MKINWKHDKILNTKIGDLKKINKEKRKWKMKQ